MVMTGLALRSVRKRPGRFTATLLSAWLGAGIIMAFNAMHDTAGADGVDDVSARSLGIAAGVVGGYGTLLVFFAIASTLTVNVRQREAEIALLRSAGATPGQIKRMVLVEAAVVALLGAGLAVAPAMYGGRLLLEAFQDSGQVAKDVDFVFGPIALITGFDITLVAACGAAFLAVRRATRAPDPHSRRRAGRGRVVGGLLALVAGASSAGATLVFDEDDPALMAPAAYGAILLSVGFAVFAPSLLKGVLGWTGRPLQFVAGGSGYLTVHGMRQRATQLTGMLMPLIIFTGMATATLAIQAIENDAIAASGVEKSVGDKNIETLNMIVVGVIVVFSLIMLINILYAATSYRAREFGQQRLAGATPRQVLMTVGLEATLLGVVGVVFGGVAAAGGIAAFHQVRTDEPLPTETFVIAGVITAVALAATLVTSLGTARRVLRTPAIDAVALTA